MKQQPLKPKLLDLFSGIGGFRLGLEQAGFEAVGYCEADPAARAVYESMFQPINEWCSTDIANVKSTDLPEADIWSFGFPCFPAGSLVKTTQGLKPIETITEGTNVLTHSGRYCPVNQTMKRKTNELIQLSFSKISDHPPLCCTPNHPFYVVDKNASSAPIWKKAKDIQPGDQIVQPLDQIAKLPSGSPWDTFEELVGNQHFWMALGQLWSYEGFLSKNHSIAREQYKCFTNVCVATKELTFEDWYQAIQELEQTSEEYEQYPNEILNLPTSLLRVFLIGLCRYDSIGIDSTHKFYIPVYNKHMIWQVRYMMLRLQHQSCIPRSSTDLNFYAEVWVEALLQVAPEPYCVMPVTQIQNIELEEAISVYNLGVLYDNSYTINLLACHNCQDISVAGNQKGITGRRSGLFYAVTDLLSSLEDSDPRKPGWITAENVAHLLFINGGWDFASVIRELDACGYDVWWTVEDTSNYGVPQQRQRLFIIGHLRSRGPRTIHFERKASKKTLKRLNKDASPQEGERARQGERIYRVDGLSPSVTCDNHGIFAINAIEWLEKSQYGRRIKRNEEAMFTLTCAVKHGVMIQDDQQYIIRKLTPRETFRLQGFPDDYFDRAAKTVYADRRNVKRSISNSSLYRQSGNAVSVPVARYIGELIMEAELAAAEEGHIASD
ncbi:MAG: DNA (cytosine-5-)-methyltransferase [Fastidiosipilaceae bacterium]